MLKLHPTTGNSRVKQTDPNFPNYCKHGSSSATATAAAASGQRIERGQGRLRTASDVPVRMMSVLRMARSPGLGRGGLAVPGLDTRSAPEALAVFAATVLLIMLSSQFCVSSSASWPICTARKQ